MTATRERKDIPEEYKWDLSKLFSSDDDWEKALEKISPAAEALEKYRGQLTESPAVLREYYDGELALSGLIENLYCYAILRTVEDGRDTKARSMSARAMTKIVQIEQALSFAEPEILSMSGEKLALYADSEVLQPYRTTLKRLIDRKAHTLTAAEEKLLASFGEVLQAPSELNDMLSDIDLKFDKAVDCKGEAHEVTQASYISLQQSGDRILRESAFRSYYAGFKSHINTYAANYAASVKGDCLVALQRRYASSREMAASLERVPVSVCEGLITSVHNHMDAMYRYLELRKKILGLTEIHYFDVYAPLAGETDAHYSYEEAQQMVLQAVSPLGKDYCRVVEQAFKDRWIDVYPNVGKQSGAFSSGTYDSNPYIKCNFTGTVDAVSTIAHEMGHSMHSYLSRHAQPRQYADYTIFVAEVASTVNENLMIEQMLKENIDDRTRLYLLNHYLENFKGTIYRQTMFAEFEKSVHEMYENGEALTAEALCRTYEDLVRFYFGPELVFDEEVRCEWARIPHFYTAFYVYKYATSYAAAVALSEKILSQGEKAVKPYLEFLSLGGSLDPLEELKTAGIDMSTLAPIDAALEKFDAIVAETEKVYDRLNARSKK